MKPGNSSQVEVKLNQMRKNLKTVSLQDILAFYDENRELCRAEQMLFMVSFKIQSGDKKKLRDNPMLKQIIMDFDEQHEHDSLIANLRSLVTIFKHLREKEGNHWGNGLPKKSQKLYK